MNTLNNIDISKEEILKVIEPFIIKHYSENDPEWQKKLSIAANCWRFNYIKSCISRLFRGSAKKVGRVKSEYSQVWATAQYPGSLEISESSSSLFWGSEGYILQGWAEKRVHLLLFSKLLSKLKPKRVLEVGSGNGAMLMMLSLMHPDIEFVGIELTDVGVNAAKKMQNQDKLSQSMIDFLPYPAQDSLAYKKVSFQVGNAMQLPFEAASFDVCITSLALEQMNNIKAAVLRELARVVADYVLMIEPFPNFNKHPIQRYYTKARDYFSVNVVDLTNYGLEPVYVFGDFPSKITRGVGLVVAKPIRE